MAESNHSQLSIAERILSSRARLAGHDDSPRSLRKAEAEGGCGVIGIASSVPIEGRHLLQALVQMRNRANGKGGGAALAGIDPAALGTSSQVLANCYLLAVAYLAEGARSEVERERIDSMFEVEHIHLLPVLASLDPPAPRVVLYFVRPKSSRLDELADLGKLRAAYEE